MRIEIDKEEYKDLIETKEEFVKTVRKLENIIIENIKLTDKLQTKEQECEKLKKQYNCNACGTCKGKEDYKNMQRHCKNAIAQNHKYKQALIEIEDYVRDNCDFDKSDKLISDTGAYDILEMIPYDIKQRTVSNGINNNCK